MRRMAIIGQAVVAAAGLVAGLAAPAHAAGRTGQLSSIVKHAQQVHDLEISDEDEQKIGAGVSEKIRARYGVVQDPAIHKYVELVGRTLTAHSSRPNIPWKFIVLDTDGVNALAAPGGYIHVTRGALSLMKNEAELADVLGHEIIHVTEKHTIRAIQKGKAIQMGASETLANTPSLLNKMVDKATEAVMAGFGRNEELEADDKGIAVAAAAGYDPKGLGNFLTTIAERNKNSTSKQGLFASHPEMDERLKKLEKTIADKKLEGVVIMEARLHENVKYKPVAQTSIATVSKGAAGLAGDSGSTNGDQKKSDDKPADDGKKKKGGFGLGKLMTSSSSEQKSAENTSSASGRGLRDTERDAKGGPNPALVPVKVTAAELTAFKKEGKLT
jgi:beta-barrel assembly-enhancing protease